MLVATIAATATYRWITREGESSASRMLRSEAYMSAVSGIEAARSWMTYHGNDLGALIADYFANDKKPILLDSALSPLNRSGQNYNVWLTGVNAEKNSYKLKIFSEGEARNGAKHSEVAILNVSGLYRVQIPQEGTEISFDKAFFGESNGFVGTDKMQSGIINGDFSGNQPQVEESFLVTGNVTYQGNTSATGDLYIGGNLSNQGALTLGNPSGGDTNVVYIGGNLSDCAGSKFKVYGDLYVGGYVSANCEVEVTGNFTLGGTIFRTGDKRVTVGKNWVFTESGKMDISGDNAAKYNVSGTMVLPDIIESHCNMWGCGDGNGNRNAIFNQVYRYNKTDYYSVLGQSKAGYPKGVYMQGTTQSEVTDGCSANGYTDNSGECKSKRLFSFKGNFESSPVVSKWDRKDNVLKAIGGNYWENYDKMLAYKNLIVDGTVPDPILLKDKDSWMGEKANDFCNLPTTDGLNTTLVDAINECYVKAKDENKLYNDFLVLEMNIGSSNGNSNHSLNGKFVFILTGGAQLRLPSTTSNSVVMLYMPQGWNSDLMPADGSGNDPFNYFIYSEGDIRQLLQWSSKSLAGSIMMANGSQLGTSQGGTNLKYNGDVIRALADAGFIQENPEYTTLTGGSSGGSSATSTGAYDSYYIATAAQLSITLESQYEAKEKAPSANNYNGISPSILVLPRVIYLNRDPVGQLSDYYTVLNLNGANETPSASNVSCSPSGINTTGLLYQNDALIDEGIYECAYSSTGSYGTVPFYVVVSGTAGTTPAVKFKESVAEIAPGGTCAEVTLVVPSSTRANPISVDVSVSSLPSDWTMTALSGVSERSGTTDLNRIFTASATPSATGASEIALFKVCANSGAAQGTMLFQLVTPCEGCIIGSPNLEIVAVTGHAEVERKSLEAYCAQTENAQICEDEGWDEKAHYPDCDDFISGSWVEASGLNCSVEEVNNKWSCGTNLSIGLKGVSSVPDYCERIIPSENNSILSPENDQTYPLYASVKRKPYTLTVKLEGASSNDAKIHVYESATGTYPSSPSYTCTQSDGACDYTVYAGSRIKLSYEEGSDKFSYWKCLGDNCPVNISNSSDYSLLISADNEVTAKFNDKDKHCFYEDFLSLKAFCSTGETNCIQNCTSSGGCDISQTSANWQMMFTNVKGNNKSNAAPVIKDGAIYTTNTKNANNKNGTQTLVLRAADAGSNGTMTSLFQTTIMPSNKQNEFLNSGIIFRANATMSEYLILNVFGVGSGDEGVLSARICKGASQGIQNSSGCETTVLVDENGNAVTISSTSMIKFSMTVSSSSLVLKARVASSNVGATMDISSYGMNDLVHQYVGFALADAPFRLYDLGWESSDYGEECWDTPKLNCSFKANYLGWIVPKDSLVTPWVGVSSWFSAKGCSLKYYYNGWDNQTAYDGSAWGEFGFSLDGSDYQFSESGSHGVPYSGSFIWQGITYNYTGIRQNVVVKATCPSDLNSSFSGDTASCGTFMVGEVVRCSENAVILSGASEYVSADVEREFSTVSLFNLREATLYFHIADLDENATITVYLKDSSGNYSLPGTLYANGDQSLNVNVMSDLDAFDPQNVTAVILKGTSYFNVSYIASSCPYALGIASCNASYNGVSWKIAAAFTNPEGVASNGCSVTPSSSEINGLSDVTCPTDGSGFSISDPDLYTRLNNGGVDLSYSFVVKAKSSTGSEVSCTTDEVTFKPAAITCSVAKSEVFTGAGVPKLTYRIDNCPSSGCDYTLELEGTGESASGTTSGNSETWSPTANTTPPLSAGEYFYKISSMGKTASCNFTVKEASPASVSNCRIEGNTFKADVTPADNGSDWSIVVAIHDQLGNTLNTSSTQTGSGTAYSYTLPSISATETDATYWALLYLNGNGIESCKESFTVKGTGVSSSSNAAEVSSSSSETVSSSSSAGAITATCNVQPNNYNISGSDALYDSQDAYFLMKNNTNEAATFDVSLYEGAYSKGSGTISSWSGVSSINLGKLSAGTHTFTLQASGKTICSVSLTVKEESMECSVEDLNGNKINSIDMGQTYVLKWICIQQDPNSFGGNYSKNGSYVGGASCSNGICSVTTSENSPGSFVYTLASWNCNSSACTNTIDINDVAPTITCPDNMTKSVGSTVSVTPKSLSGCTNGCSYTIEGTSASGNGYTGGAISFAGASYAVTETYTFNVSNSKGERASCSFNVEYSASATIDITASYGSYQSYTPGKCYSITMAGGRVWRCTAGSQSTTTRFIGVFNSSNFNIEAWQTQATTTNPGSGSVVEFCVDDNAPTDLQCANDW